MWLALPLLGIIYLFLFWRKLREDYYQEALFSLSLVQVLVLTGLYWLIQYRLVLNFYYLEVVFVVIAYLLVSLWFKRGEVNKIEIIEGSLIAYWWVNLFWCTLLLFKDWSHWQSLGLEVFVTVLSLVVYLIVNNNYKKFGWYRSGRVGIAGLTALGAALLLKGSVVFVFPTVFHFPIAPLIFGAFAFLDFMLVYMLANQK
jgi:hypothetical protein